MELQLSRQIRSQVRRPRLNRPVSDNAGAAHADHQGDLSRLADILRHDAERDVIRLVGSAYSAGYYRMPVYSRPRRAYTAGALGHPVAYQQVPDDIARSYGPDLHAMFRYFDTVGLDVDTDALRHDFPEVGWHTMEQWLATHDWSAARRPPR